MGDIVKLNEKLRAARRERSWTQAQLAEELGVGVSTVRSWESGSRSPSLPFRRAICMLFQMTPEELGFVPSQEDRTSDKSGDENEIKNAVQASLTVQEFSPSVTMRSSRKDEDRDRMLNRVRSRWITGFLDLVADASLIQLHLTLRPDAVASPWRGKNQELYFAPSSRIVQTQQIYDLYEKADGELLILGEPGAGKTTVLLELTRELLAQCRIDGTAPIPVIFNLSAWAQSKAHFADRLVDELHMTYQVPIQLAQEWISSEQIFPLLDGLDEVAIAARAACVEAINAYRKEHGLLPIVICCRTSDYFSLPERLIVNMAAEIQPLTRQQIDTYMAHQKNLSALRAALQTDEKLQEVVSTPLMLTILASNAAQGLIPENTQPLNLSFIFEQYVERLLDRSARQHYAPEQAKQWLSWLALQMKKHNLAEFRVERLQPDWLESGYRLYRNAVIRIVYGATSLLVAGLYACFRSDSVPDKPGLFYWLGGNGLGNTILGWMAPGIGEALRGGTSLGLIVFLVSLIVAQIVSRRTFRITRSIVRSGVLTSMRYGVITGVFLGLFAGIVYGMADGIAMGFYRGIGYGISEGIIVGMLVAVAKIVSSAHNSDMKYTYAPRNGERMVNYLIYVCCGALGMISIYSLESGGFSFSILLLGLMMGVGSGLIYSIANFSVYLYPGVMSSIIEPTERLTWSWEAVRKEIEANLMKGVSVLFMVALPVMFIWGWASTIFHGPSYGIRYGLVYGSIVGVISGVAAMLAGILDSGNSRATLEDKDLNTPNQGIQNSWRHACFAGGLFGGIGGVAAGAICGLAFWTGGVPGWFTLMLGFTLVFSVLFAFWFWMSYGGVAVIEHYVLRWYLIRSNAMPANYVAFLDEMAEQAVLRKVGGGYIFSHRLLLEHFAQLKNTHIGEV